MRDELRRQAGPGGGALEVFLVAAADDELVLAALKQVPVGRGAVLADRLVHVLRQGDVAELSRLAELERSQLRAWVDLLTDAQGLAPADATPETDRESLADP